MQHLVSLKSRGVKFIVAEEGTKTRQQRKADEHKEGQEYQLTVWQKYLKSGQ